VYIKNIHNKLVKFVSIFYKIKAKFPPDICSTRRLIYFAFVHSQFHICYMVLEYMVIRRQIISLSYEYLIIDCRVFYSINVLKCAQHICTIHNLLYHYIRCTVIRFWSSCIDTFIIEMNCLPYFLHILRKSSGWFFSSRHTSQT